MVSAGLFDRLITVGLSKDLLLYKWNEPFLLFNSVNAGLDPAPDLIPGCSNKVPGPDPQY